LLTIFIAIAGAIGALLRYWLSTLIPSIFIMNFPVSTLFINVVGTFILSWFFSYIHTTKKFPTPLKNAIASGLIGSFTTFSTFNVELVQLLETHSFVTAVIYFIASVGGGYGCVLLGRRVIQ
jgi:CrcB protein